MLLKSKRRITGSIMFFALAFIMASCSRGNGELTGVQDREDWYQDDPIGMLFIPMGSYNMGTSDEDVPYTQTNPSKTVSVQAFYIDETEITNNEYRQFTNWVRDSIAHVLLALYGNPDDVGNHYQSDRDGNPIDYGQQNFYNLIDWDEYIEWDNEEVRMVLEDPNGGIFLPEHEQFYHMRQIDTRKLNFTYYWINMRAASQRGNRPQGLVDRSVFIESRTDNIYPDTLCWVHDFTYSYNEPMTQNYYWHPAYDHYPVVGVSWIQARAFSIWRTGIKRSYHQSIGATLWNDFRLPTESEWEWASRGGKDLNPYPWGGPYVRNSNGCFLANYKPLRGNYVDDGGFHTLIVAHFAPNDYGLYDMAGNVSEWCDDSYIQSTYQIGHDLNMQISKDLYDEFTTSSSRRVLRGGSWKDIGYYIRTSARSYEYQDTAKAYIGFRNVQTYLGRAKGDGPNSSAVYR